MSLLLIAIPSPSKSFELFMPDSDLDWDWQFELEEFAKEQTSMLRPQGDDDELDGLDNGFEELNLAALEAAPPPLCYPVVSAPFII